MEQAAAAGSRRKKTYELCADIADAIFSKCGVSRESAAAEARIIVEKAFGLDFTAIMAGPWREEAPEKAIEKAFAMAERRAAGEPVQYITGEAWFFGRRFAVSPDVLIPRNDTECVLSEALEFLKARAAAGGRPSNGANRKGTGDAAPSSGESGRQDNAAGAAGGASVCAGRLRVLDIGTGSGILAVSIAAELPEAVRVAAVDISEKALAVARANAASNGVSRDVVFGRSDCFDGVETLCGSGMRFDLIVSNPPYIRDGEYAGLSPEVRREPKIALTAGSDGLGVYRRMIAGAREYLSPGGSLVLEIGHDMAAEVIELGKASGFNNFSVFFDMGNRQRGVRLWE